MELYGTLGETTLNGSITDSALSLTVTSASAFLGGETYVSGGVLRGRLDDGTNVEIVKITNISGTTFTIVRAQEGTSAHSFGDGTSLKQVQTAASFDGIRYDICQTGSLAALPAARKAGQLYLPNDSLYAFRDDGSAWAAFGPIYKMTPPSAVAADFSWVNQETATVSAAGGALSMLVPQTAGADDMRIRTKTLANPRTVTAAFMANCPSGAGASRFGIGVRNSSTGVLATMGHRNQGTQLIVEVNHCASPNSVTVIQQDGIAFAHFGPVRWFRIVTTSTQITYFWSYDGVTWIQTYTETIAASGVGTIHEHFWFGFGRSVDDDGYFSLVSWKEE